MATTREALAKVAEALPGSPTGNATWQLNFSSEARGGGVGNVSIEAFVSGKTKSEAIEAFLNNVREEIERGDFLTPWNSVARAADNAGSNHTVARGDGKKVRVFIPRK